MTFRIHASCPKISRSDRTIDPVRPHYRAVDEDYQVVLSRFADKLECGLTDVRYVQESPTSVGNTKLVY